MIDDISVSHYMTALGQGSTEATEGARRASVVPNAAQKVHSSTQKGQMSSSHSAIFV